jgi:hypothetical protein
MTSHLKILADKTCLRIEYAATMLWFGLESWIWIRWIAQNGRSPLTTFLSIRYAKVGCIHKYPMMVWTHQLSCCENSILLSVFNSHLFLSSSSMPRPLAYRHSLPLSNRYCMAILKTCNEVLFFVSVIPSEIRRFKFKVSWLCDDDIAAENLRHKSFSTSRYDSHLFVLSKDFTFKNWSYIDCLPRVGWWFVDGDGYRSKKPINVSNVPFPIFSARRFPVWKWRTPRLYMFRLCGSPVS